MKTWWIIFIISLFSFCISQKLNAQIIDGVSVLPIGLSIGAAENNHPTLEKDENSLIFSYQFGIELNKLLFKKVEIFSGVGHRRNLERTRINLPIEFFLEQTETLPSDVPTADENLWIRYIKFTDSYISVPIGLRYFIVPKKKEGFNLSFAYELDYFHLLNSRTDVDIAVVSNVIFFVPIYSSVDNTIYENQIEQFFKMKANKSTFFHNFKVGLQYNFNEKNILALEFYSQVSIKNHKSDLFKKYNAYGVNIMIGHFF